MKKHLFTLAIFPLAVTAILTSTLLTGCGVDTATTAATEAKLKTEEAERARQQMEAAKKQIDAAQQEMQKRIADADRDAAGAPASDTSANEQADSKP
ncbi:MAG: hypothetical protein LBB65_08685 [Burkholderiales bacterium]|jgi:hypothetical protein|nr:hypothetical protein [Burkholderiales bacterium]